MDTLVLLAIIASGTITVVFLLVVFFVRFFQGSGKRERPDGAASSPAGTLSPVSNCVSTIGSSNVSRKKQAVNEESYFRHTEVPLVQSTSFVARSPEIATSAVDAVLIDLIRQAFELPSGLMELSHLLRDYDSSIKEITKLVSTDPALSSSLLRIANSAAVGRGKITSLQKAILLLGYNQVWILVNQMLTSRAMKPIAKLDPASMKRLWLHGAATAVCAKHILLRLGLLGTGAGSTAMTCALIHDVGKFMLRGFNEFDYTLLQTKGKDPDQDVSERSLIELEYEFYSIDHTRVGYLLSTYWGLPEEVCTVIGYHHYPFSSNYQEAPSHVAREISIVAYADYLAQAAGYYEYKYGISALNPDAMRSIGVIPPFAAMLDGKMINELRSTARLIDMAARYLSYGND